MCISVQSRLRIALKSTGVHRCRVRLWCEPSGLIRPALASEGRSGPPWQRRHSSNRPRTRDCDRRPVQREPSLCGKSLCQVIRFGGPTPPNSDFSIGPTSNCLFTFALITSASITRLASALSSLINLHFINFAPFKADHVGGCRRK